MKMTVAQAKRTEWLIEALHGLKEFRTYIPVPTLRREDIPVTVVSAKLEVAEMIVHMALDELDRLGITCSVQMEKDK